MKGQDPEIQNEKNKKVNLKYFIKNERGRAILFFAFYFVFFALIIGAIRTNDQSSSTPNNSSNNTNTEIVELNSLANKNYHFKYTFDDTLYEGNKFGGEELFTVITEKQKEEYYISFTNVLKKENDKWINSENPFSNKQLFDIKVLTNIFNKSTLLSKTEYNDKTIEKRYTIDTTILYNLLNNTNLTMKEEELNTISLYSLDNKVLKIEFDLENYQQVYQEMPKFVTLEYSEHDKITHDMVMTTN